MANEREHIVIIGGGFAGINVLKQLKNADHCRVTIIDKSNHHLFQPLLYQVATAAISPGDIAMPIRGLTGGQPNTKVLMAEVASINKNEQQLSLSDGRTLHFDKLIVATGSQYNYFGNDEWKDYAPGLKSIADALEIRERILLSIEKAVQTDDAELRQQYLTFAIIGGGPTGVETAGAIAEIVKNHLINEYAHINPDEPRIFLIEAADGILNSFPASLSNKARQTLEDMGVTVLLENGVEELSENVIHLSDGTINTPNIIWAAGVKAAPLLQSLNSNYDKMGRLKVTNRLHLPENPAIFVIGDSAHFEQDGNPLPSLAPVAIQQGTYLGKLLAKGTAIDEAEPFEYFDKGTMATIGRGKAIADVRGFTLSGFLAWLMWGVVHIFFLIGFRNRFRTFGEWVWHYATFKRGVWLITNRFTPDDKSGSEAKS